LLPTYASLSLGGTWAALTTPGSRLYHALWAPLIIFELAGNLGFVIVQLWLLVLFFRRSKIFPKLYVWMALVNLPFVVVDAWLLSIILPEEPMFDSATAIEFARSIVTAAIWAPYMLVSRRVKNTFIT